MKRLAQLLLFLFTTIHVESQTDTLMARTMRLIGKKVPDYQNITIDGKKIDSAYFMGKVTILSFFGFGCGPCYQELSLLNEISRTYSKEKYQILFLADVRAEDLRDFRAYRSKRFRKMKRKLGVDTLAFDIIADCPENRVRLLNRSCKGSTETFKVCAFPSTFFINREGIIKDICMGFAMPRNKEFDDYFYAKLREAEK